MKANATRIKSFILKAAVEFEDLKKMISCCDEYLCIDSYVQHHDLLLYCLAIHKITRSLFSGNNKLTIHCALATWSRAESLTHAA